MFMLLYTPSVETGYLFHMESGPTYFFKIFTGYSSKHTIPHQHVIGVEEVKPVIAKLQGMEGSNSLLIYSSWTCRLGEVQEVYLGAGTNSVGRNEQQ